MSAKGSDNSRQILEEVRRNRQEREKTYRERALKMYPWICAHCGREFEGKRLKELTVHHKDHNHDNNPPDGSNWELLCIYCHDNEHSRDQVADAYGDAVSGDSSGTGGKTNPFAGLGDMLKGKLD
ncbi:MAG: YajD family HNH nuclease [Desulfobacterales bacterium]|nr:YajD family HNH nuclease [Desulfobacterales bacterium]